jgi:hypothetical protein
MPDKFLSHLVQVAFIHLIGMNKSLVVQDVAI